MRSVGRFRPSIYKLFAVAFVIILSLGPLAPVVWGDGPTTGSKRNVATSVKDYLKKKAGISKSQWKNYEIDHKIPLWKGGSNRISNLQVLSSSAHEVKTKREATQRAKADGIYYGKKIPTKSYKSGVSISREKGRR